MEEYLVLQFSPLVKSMAHRFHRYTGLEREDLEQTGYIGLIKALERFDPAVGAKFSTFAANLVIGEIRSSLRKDLRIAGITRDSSGACSNSAGSISRKSGHPQNITIDEIAGAAGISREEAAVDRCSYRLLLPGDEFLDGLAVKDNADEKYLQELWLKDALSGLEPDERKIIFYRFFKEKTQEEVARLTGTTQKQVSRMEKKILRKMKEQMQAEG